jgi:hypothetical protein
MSRLLLIILLTTLVGNIFAQSSNDAPLHDMNTYMLDRLMIKRSNFGNIHPNLQPYNRADLLQYVNGDSLDKISILIPEEDYIRKDNDTTVKSNKPFLKYLYKSPANLFEVKKPNFYLAVNPMMHIAGGADRGDTSNAFVLLNRRGINLRGTIGKKVCFYTDIIESQASPATYVKRRIEEESAVPGAGFYKTYNSSLTPQADDGVDYLMSQGYIGFNATPFIGVQLGHGRHFIGDGRRSLLLSDFSNNYFYLKFNTKVWRIHYQNIFAELIQDRAPVANNVYPKKYMAAHHLSINILDNLNVGLFESIIFARENGFELQYLNPLIFYRTVEQALGSPDNVTLGMNARWDFLKHFSLYGQVVIDEFVFAEVFSGEGWWANKQGVQLGIKYIDVAKVKGLDFQAEFNTVRPYTYTFRDSTANYTHYNQPLAHPMGANFQEFIGILRYNPQFLAKLHLRAQLNYANYGLDTMGSNWGANIHISYIDREMEYGNKTGQGVSTNLLWGQFMASYMLKHNFFVDLNLIYRREDAALDALDNNSLIFSMGLRWNMVGRQEDW